MQRLDKILSEAGIASRKDLRQMIRAGRVTVDGAAALAPMKSMTTDGSAFFWTASRRAGERFILMLNKPAGYIHRHGGRAAADVMS